MSPHDATALLMATVQQIGAMVRKYSREPRVIEQARAIVGVMNTEREPVLAVDRLCSWVRANIGYSREASELLQDPLTTLLVRSGDCDDHVILVASLARSLQLPAHPALIARPARQAHHIVVAMGPGPAPIGDRIVIFDSTVDPYEADTLAGRIQSGAETITIL